MTLSGTREICTLASSEGAGGGGGGGGRGTTIKGGSRREERIRGLLRVICRKSQNIVIQKFCKQCHSSNVTLSEMII
jgi:hypothetical protein